MFVKEGRGIWLGSIREAFDLRMGEVGNGLELGGGKAWWLLWVGIPCCMLLPELPIPAIPNAPVELVRVEKRDPEAS